MKGYLSDFGNRNFCFCVFLAVVVFFPLSFISLLSEKFTRVPLFLFF